jgi:AcrR family transcriptional regulator
MRRPISSPASKAVKRVPRTQGRPAGEKSIGKDVLIQKAAELLRTLPPEKLSMTAVAKHAGVHLTLVRYYFSGRPRLLASVAKFLTIEIGDRVKEMEQPQTDARERLRIRIDAMVDFYLQNPFYLRLMLEVTNIQQDEFVEELIELWMSKTMDIYRDIIKSGVSDGTLRPLDEFYTFFAIMGLCEQFRLGIRAFERIGIGRAETTEKATARYKEFLYDFVINGIGAGATSKI